MNLRINLDGSYNFEFRAEDLPIVVRLVKQNEIWRKEEAEKKAARARAKVEEAESLLAEPPPELPS